MKLKSVGSLQGKKPAEKCTVHIREKLGEVEIVLKDMPPKSVRSQYVREWHLEKLQYPN